MAGSKVGPDVLAAAGAALALILLALAIGDSTFGWLAGIAAAALLVYSMAKAPLRSSLLVIAFCAMVLENPAEMFAAGQWKSPFEIVGALMLTHMKNTTGVSFMSFSGTDLALICLLLISWYRKSKRSKIDAAGRVPTPRALIRLAYLSLAGTAYVWVSGLIRGGTFSISLWQIDKVIYLPIVFLLFHLGLRGPRDYRALVRTLLTAAAIRAALAVYISKTVFFPSSGPGEGEPLPWATSHHDSILFADAVVLIISLLMHRVKGANKLALYLLPLLLWGMSANNRRMVWVQIILVFTTLYLSTPMTAAKRKVKKIVMYISPVLTVYIAIGWQVNAAPFAPVQTIRGMFDSKDPSSITRDIENYDLVSTIKQYHIWGTGYGNGYWELISLPPMGYDLERYCPHNSLIGLWVYAGYFGFVAMTMLWVGGIYFGVRAYRTATSPTDRAAALTSFGAVLVYLIQCYGDVGLGAWTGVFTVAPALAMAGKLAVATGAWPTAERPRKKAVASGPQRPRAEPVDFESVRARGA